jgi:hypothetical protein
MSQRVLMSSKNSSCPPGPKMALPNSETNTPCFSGGIVTSEASAQKRMARTMFLPTPSRTIAVSSSVKRAGFSRRLRTAFGSHVYRQGKVSCPEKRRFWAVADFWISSVLMADQRSRRPWEPYILWSLSRCNTTYSVWRTFETENVLREMDVSALGGAVDRPVVWPAQQVWALLGSSFAGRFSPAAPDASVLVRTGGACNAFDHQAAPFLEGGSR